MQTKLFEIRDRGTFIPIMATLMRPRPEPRHGELVAADYREAAEAERYLLGRAGYPFEFPLVYVSRIENPRGHSCQGTYDRFDWGDSPRTMHVAHGWIEEHWEELKTGDVIDVEFLLEETQTKKRSERFSVRDPRLGLR